MTDNQLAASGGYSDRELHGLLAALPSHGLWRDDDASAGESYYCDIEDGALYVWLGRTTARPDDARWYYGVEVGHTAGGAHPLDEPEFMVDYEIVSRAATSKADAQFQALRAYARWQVLQDAYEWEMTVIMAGDPEDPNPDWWKA